MQPTDLTVAAIIEQQGRYLIVEEYSSGRRVLTQPGGHIEAGEAPEEAVIREVFEESGCEVACGELIGTYLWIHPQTRRQYLRLMFEGTLLSCDETARLDDGIIARRWFSRDELQARQPQLRTPVVLRSIHDFESGQRRSDALFNGMLPLQHNVDAVLAKADLV